jgi:hypothetical protein
MSAQTIIDAIDAAIAAWADKPVTLSNNGRTTTYRSLRELIEARRYYASLAASAATTPTTGSLRITRLSSGGTV